MTSQYRSEAARDECFAYLDSRARKEWPIASEARTVSTSFGPTFVRISGPPNGQPLVLLPGAAGSSLMWTPNIEALSADWRTFAVDQIGDFGRSICTSPLKRYDDLIAWLTEFFDALELRSGVNLLGISYGGALAAEYGRQCPQRIHSLVLIAPAATVLGLNPQFVVRLIGAVMARDKGLSSLFRWLFADSVRQQPEWVDATLEQLRLHMRCARRALPFPRVWKDADWRTLSVPTLFLVGNHEKIYSPEKAVRRLNRVAPQVRAEIVEGAGHDLTFVQAAAVNRSILRFLKQASVEPAHATP